MQREQLNNTFCALAISAAVILNLIIISALIVPANANASGKRYSAQGARLAQSIHEALVSNGLCQTPRQCYDVLPRTLETDSIVFIQFFNVNESNQPALSIATALTLSNGTNITGGIPIKIEMFRESHDEYRKSGIIFKGVKPFATLEVLP